MNKVKKKNYHLTGVLQAVFISIVLSLLMTPVCTAGPKGEEVVRGDVRFQRDGKKTTIRASDKSIIRYRSFDIQRPETVRFIQPSSTSKVLNRVDSSNPTNIYGSLKANGIVYLTNPAGIYFHNGSTVDVGGICAAAGHISNKDFTNDIDHFTNLTGEVKNWGNINAGLVRMLGAKVKNFGTISAPEGTISMQAGDDILVGTVDGYLYAQFNGAAAKNESGEAAVSNQGTIDAEDGQVALGAGDMIGLAVHNKGTIESDNVQMTADDGDVINEGTVDAGGESGGDITMSADRVAQLGTMHADGRTLGGGDIDIHAEEVVALGSESLTTANAGENGDGGEVIVFSPEMALFRPEARIEARGGSTGGFVEASGHEHIEIAGSVNTTAPSGQNGTFLIDPLNITISDEPDAKPGEWSEDFKPTGSGANVNVDTLVDQLKQGNVTVTTQAESGEEAGNIELIDPIDYDGVQPAEIPSRLSLMADNDITLGADVADSNPGDDDALSLKVEARGSLDLEPGTELASQGGDIELIAGCDENSNGQLWMDAHDEERITVDSGGGDVEMRGNAGPEHDRGVGIYGANIHVTGGEGDITMKGEGADYEEYTENFNRGMEIDYSSLIETTGGDVALTGRAGENGDESIGIAMYASGVETEDGQISMSGYGGDSPDQSGHHGVAFYGPECRVTAAGSGSVTIEGKGGQSTGNSCGLALEGADSPYVQVNKGALQIDGEGGTASAGVNLSAYSDEGTPNGEVLSTGSGNITINAGKGTDADAALVMDSPENRMGGPEAAGNITLIADGGMMMGGDIGTGGQVTLDAEGDITVDTAGEPTFSAGGDMVFNAGDNGVITMVGETGTVLWQTEDEGSISLDDVRIAKDANVEHMELNASNGIDLSGIDASGAENAPAVQIAFGSDADSEAELTSGMIKGVKNLTVEGHAPDGAAPNDSARFTGRLSTVEGGIQMSMLDRVAFSVEDAEAERPKDAEVQSAGDVTLADIDKRVFVGANNIIRSQTGDVVIHDDANDQSLNLVFDGEGDYAGIEAPQGSLNMDDVVVTDEASVKQLYLGAKNDVALDTVTLDNAPEARLSLFDVGSFTANELQAGIIDIKQAETVHLNGPMTATHEDDGSLYINGSRIINLAGDLTAAQDVQMASTEEAINVGENVDIVAENGSVMIGGREEQTVDVNLGGEGNHRISGESGMDALDAVFKDDGPVGRLEIETGQHGEIGDITMNHEEGKTDVDIQSNVTGEQDAWLELGSISTAGSIEVTGPRPELTEGDAGDAPRSTVKFTDTVRSVDGALTIDDWNTVDMRFEGGTVPDDTADFQSKGDLKLTDIGDRIFLGSDIYFRSEGGDMIVNDTAGDQSLEMRFSWAGEQNIFLVPNGSLDMSDVQVSDSAEVNTLGITTGGDADIGSVTLDEASSSMIYGEILGSLTAGDMKSGQIEIMAEETMDFEGTLTTTDPETGSILMGMSNEINFKDDVTAETDLELKKVNGAASLYDGVDLVAENGSVKMTEKVNKVALVGQDGSGPNTIEARQNDGEAGDIDLGAMVDYDGVGTDRTLRMQAEGDVDIDGGVADSSAGDADRLGLEVVADNAVNLGPGVEIDTQGGDILLKAANEIVAEEESTMHSRGGDITFHADSDKTDGGYIHSEAKKIASVGPDGDGNIVMSGGEDLMKDEAVGMAKMGDGVLIEGSEIIAGEGSITIRGRGSEVEALDIYRIGVDLLEEASIRTTSGDVTLVGTGGSGDGSPVAPVGIYLYGENTVETTSGDIKLIGHGENSGDSGIPTLTGGVTIEDSTLRTQSGAIDVEGEAGDPVAGLGRGIALVDGSTVVTDNGPITLHGTGGEGCDKSMVPGVWIMRYNESRVGVTTVDGDIEIVGTGGENGSVCAGVGLTGDDAWIKATGDGSIDIRGYGGEGSTAYDNAHPGVGFADGSGGIQIHDGDLNVHGFGGTGSSGIDLSSAIESTSKKGIISTGIGSIELHGEKGADDRADLHMSETANVIGGVDAKGNITFHADSMEIVDGTIQSKGMLMISPRTADRSIGIGSGDGELKIGQDVMNALQDGFSQITVGDVEEGTGTVRVEGGTFTDDLGVWGGGIQVSGLDVGDNDVSLTARGGDLVCTGGEDADLVGHSILLKAAKDIRIEDKLNGVTEVMAEAGERFVATESMGPELGSLGVMAPQIILQDVTTAEDQSYLMGTMAGNAAKLPRFMELNGRYMSREGRIALASEPLKDTVPPTATVYSGEAGQDLAIIARNGEFVMGPNEKLSVAGDLTITARRAVLGDLNALGHMDVRAPGDIGFRNRPAAPMFKHSGETVEDYGLDFVASTMRFVGLPASGEARFATENGTPVGVPESYVVSQYGPIAARDFVNPDSGKPNLDLRAEGPTRTNVASALSAAEQVDNNFKKNVLPDGPDTGAGGEPMLAGKGMKPEDFVQMLEGMVRYDQLAELSAAPASSGEETLGAGAPAGESVKRLARQVGEQYRQLLWEQTDAGEQFRGEILAQTIQKTIETYRVSRGVRNAEGTVSEDFDVQMFVSWVRDNNRKSAGLRQLIDGVKKVLQSTDKLALTARQRQAVEDAVLEQIKPEGLNLAQLSEIIRKAQ